MKLQFLKADSILPTNFYHPPYMLNNLVNYNCSETLNYRSSSVINMDDLPSSSTNCSQISELDFEEENAYLLNSEKSSSSNYLSGINSSMRTLQEIYQPSDRMEDTKYFFQPELPFQTDETILNLSDLINELKLRDDNFDTDLSASIEQQLGVKKESCFILEDFGIENNENAFEDETFKDESFEDEDLKDVFFEDVVSPNPEIFSSRKLVSKSYDEVDNTLEYKFPLSLSDGNEKKKNLTPTESQAKHPVINLETFINECCDGVEDTFPYESEILDTPYVFLSDDIENEKTLTPMMESQVRDCITDFESVICEDIITGEPLDTNLTTTYTDEHIETIDVLREKILENYHTFPEHLEKEIISSNFKTDAKFLQESFCEMVEKPTNISMAQSHIPKPCDEVRVKPLSLAKFNFTNKNRSTFSKPGTFIFDGIETFESKFDIFDNDALDPLNNVYIFNQTKIKQRLELISYEKDAISLSPSRFVNAKNDREKENTESNVEYQVEKSDSENDKEISEHRVITIDSTSYEPENFSVANDTNQQICLYEKLHHSHPTTEKDLKVNIESVSDLQSDNKTFVCDGDLEEIFSDEDEDGDNFFDSFDEMVFDEPLECIEKTELIFTSKSQDSNCNEAIETKNNVLFSDLPVIFKCVDEDTLEVKEVLLYPQERLQAIFNTSDEKAMSREEAIKQLIKESKTYDGKTIGIVPNIREPQFLQTEETDLPSNPFESYINSDSTHTQHEPQPNSNREDKNGAGDVATLFSAFFAQKDNPRTLTAEHNSPSLESIKYLTRADPKEGKDYCLKCGKNKPLATKSSNVAQKSISPKKKSSVCIRYQKRHGITGASSSVPIVKTIKENVERHTKFGCERYKRYSTYFFSPRAGRPQRGGPRSLEYKISTAQGNVKNKKVNLEEIATSDFKTHFQLYAKRGRLKSGTVISKANSNYWLRKTGVVFDGRSERVAEECFAEVAGKKLVLNIFDYIKYLIAVSRKYGLALVDIVDQLKGITKPERDLSRKSADSVVKREYQTMLPSSRAAFSRPLHIRSSRIPVSFPTVKNCRNFKQFIN